MFTRPRLFQVHATLLTLTLLASPTQAQTLEHQFFGDEPDERFGQSVAGAGDVNADGTPDFIMSATLDSTNGSVTGRVEVRSGVDGSILYDFVGSMGGMSFGHSVDGAGDVNGDGYDDVIVGAFLSDFGSPSSGSAFVYSGADGSELHFFNGDSAGDTFGQSVAGVGDVNLDGYDDVLVGIPGDDPNGPGSGTARVYSGLDGSTLHEFTGTTSDSMGSRVAAAGDVNADGYPDLMVRASGAGPASGGEVYLFSGDDGSVIHTLGGAASGDQFGFGISGAGDVNGDGYDDVIASAIFADPNGCFGCGQTRVFSGLDASVLFTWDGQPGERAFGTSVASGADVNGDLVPDLVVGAAAGDLSDTSPDFVRIFSGADGSELFHFCAPKDDDKFGLSSGLVGDTTGDGNSEIIVGSADDDDSFSDAGSVFVFSASTASPGVAYCFGDASACPCANPGAGGTGCANSTGSGGLLVASGSTSRSADDLTFDASGLVPNQFALLYCGPNAIEPPFGEGLRCVGGVVERLEVVQADGAGQASYGPGLAPIGGWEACDWRRFQVWYRDPGGPCGSAFNLTNGVSVVFRP